MFASPKQFKQALYLLQCDDKKTRLHQLDIVEAEMKEALLCVDFTYLDMMQLWKALWLCLYKEDNDDIQEEIAERIGKLIFRCPTLQEFLAANKLDENGDYISDEASEQSEKVSQNHEDSVT